MPNLSKKISFKFLKGRKKPSKKDEVDSSMSKRSKDTDIECKIVTLDSTNLTFYLEKKVLGKQLEDYTFHQIQIKDDKNYFGLQYTDKNEKIHWLDMTKQIRKQCDVGPPYIFRFQVKFFSSDPIGHMNDEYTRYLFVLQLKNMIRDGELFCQDLDLVSDIAALQLQGEFGDYKETEHTPLFISQFRFLPESQQTEEFELAVLEKYSKLRNKNMVPSMTDRQYLEKCCELPDYGIGRHKIKTISGQDYVLGLTPTGILLYEGNEKKGVFPWSQVTKLSFKKSRFKIKVQDVQESDQSVFVHFFEFQSEDESACKQLWKSCVENHAFYRLEGAHKPPTKLQQLFRLKSRFYASFHTEYQMAMKNTFGSGIGRTSTSFQRTPSVRLAPRASFEKNEVERRKIQQKYRDQFRIESKEFAIRNMYPNEESDSNESTPVATPRHNLSQLSSPLTSVYESRLPRLTSQDSTVTKASILSHLSSVDSIASESSSQDGSPNMQINKRNSTKNVNDLKPLDKLITDMKPIKETLRYTELSVLRGNNQEEIICV